MLACCLSKQLAKGMIAVRTGPEILVTIVGSAKYFRWHSSPSNSDQLAEHRCIELRYPASGTLNAWQLVNRLKSSRVKRAGGPPRRPSRFWSKLYDIGRPAADDCRWNNICELAAHQPHWLAGAPGFEPGDGGIKIRCLTTWLRPNEAGAFRIAAASAAINRSLQSPVKSPNHILPWPRSSWRRVLGFITRSEIWTFQTSATS